MALDGSGGEVPAKRKRVVVSGGSGDEGSHRHQDRISDLPNCLLLQILMLLPLVEAVRTSALSRRWRGAWTRLPRLAFDDAAAPRVSRFGDLVGGVLRGYAGDHDLPGVSISVRRRTGAGDAAHLATSAARLAAGRAAAGFHLYFHDVDEGGEDDPEEVAAAAATLELPCFPRATELALTCMGVDLRMPSTGTFAKLTKLFISSVRFADGGEGISTVVSRRCPCLESLELRRIHGVRVLSLLAQRSLLCLRLSLVMQLERLVLLAGSLLEMQVHVCFLLSTAPMLMLLNVPVLEKLHWEDRYPRGDAGDSCLAASRSS